MANHNFNITLAKRYGVEEAILIEHIYWWIHKNECEEVEDMVHDGAVWCRSTAKGFAKYIPYMKPDKIWRILKKLEGHVLRVGNFNRQALNQTLWYTFTDDFVKELKGLDYDFEKIKNAILKNEKSNISNINIPNNENKIIEDNKKRECNKLPSLKKVFVKPTIEQIADYINNKGYHFDAEQFWNHYESVGWMIGKNHMKDWHCACATWEGRRKQEIKKEENADDAMTDVQREKWKKTQEWLKEKTPTIAPLINYDNFNDMMARAHFKSPILAEVLIRIESDGCDGDIVQRFTEIIDAEYYDRIWNE